jgi:hypothetical protein
MSISEPLRIQAQIQAGADLLSALAEQGKAEKEFKKAMHQANKIYLKRTKKNASLIRAMRLRACEIAVNCGEKVEGATRFRAVLGVRFQKEDVFLSVWCGLHQRMIQFLVAWLFLSDEEVVDTLRKSLALRKKKEE